MHSQTAGLALPQNALSQSIVGEAVLLLLLLVWSFGAVSSVLNLVNSVMLNLDSLLEVKLKIEIGRSFWRWCSENAD